MENLDLRSFLYDGSHNRSGYYQSVKSPRVVQPRSDINHIRQWAGSGDVELLEKVVLEGNGERVLEEKIYEPRTHNFMKTVPNMVAKCKDLHDAVHKGSMLQLQELLQNEPLRRKYVLCKDPAGVGLLHKAVYYDFYDIASWLVDNFPETVHQKDSEGRLPLHYAAMSRSDALSLMLEKAGGNNCGSMARDAGGKTPGYYRSQAGRSRLVLPQRDDIMNVTPNSKGLVIKPSNIRIWCHDHDIAKLARIVWEGQGWRLLGEISNRGIVKKFLDAVPYLMNTIKDIHTAVIVGDFENLRKITDDPVPPIMLSSKDLNGLTALHKAAGLGKDDMVEYLVNRYRDCINQQDFFGRTPLFYAASHNGDDVTFQTLTNLGAKQEILDDRGKTAAYYITRYNEVDRTVLVVIPEAPRTPSSNYPPNWDWKILEVSKEEVRNRSRSRRRHKSSSENITSNSRNSENAMINEPKSNMKMSNTQDFIKSLPNLNDHKLNYGEMKPKEKAKDEVHFKIKADKRSKSKNITENLSVGEHLSNTVKDVDKQMEAPFVPLNELTKPEHFNQSTSNSKKGEIATDINQKEKTNLSPASHDNDKIMSMSPEKIIASPKSVLRSHENENDISPSKVDKTVDLPKHAETKEAKSPVYNLVKEPHIKPVAPQNYRNEQIPKDESEHIISDIPSMIENSETKTDSVIENAKTELEQKLNTAPGLAEEKIMDHETDTSSNEEKKITSDDLKNSKIEPTLIVEKVAGSIEDDSRIVTSSTPQRMRRTSGCAKTKEKADIGEKANVVEKDQNKNHLSEDDSDDEDVQVQGESDSNLSETDMNLSGTKVSSSKSSSAKIGASSGHGAKERLIKGLVKGGPDDNLVNAGNEEIDSIKHDEPVMTKLNYGQAEVHDAEVEDFLNSGNMEMLASLVLNGEGSRLVGRKSNNREMQAFIDNVPTYMKKINRVHVAAREGNIRDLQAALDRRKFAIARDPISPNGCTPLHVATVFGKTNIIKYLGARFPETLSAVDFEGRTALHYAAVIPDNGHFFNLLQHLGANTKDIDDQGKSAEDYRNSEQFTYKQLLDDFDVDEATGNVLLADRGTNTTTDETVDIPSFKTDEGRFLAKSLGEPLMKGLTEVANVKPKDPIAYLASYLSNFPEGEKLQLKSQENQESAPNTSNVGNNVFGNLNETNSEAVYPIGSSSNRRIEAVDVENITPESAGTPDGPESALSSEIRDEHGQSMLHFAAARSHSRRNALLQMLQESNINIGYRDELYRTARDVTLQANALQNTSEIDNYVLQLAATGKADKIMELLLEGYDHILDVTDDDGKSITDVIMQRGLTEIKDLLNSIPPFESTREELHQAIRMGLLDKVKATLLSPERGRMLAIAKNINGRTSLHIAVLVENEEIVEYLAWSFPELLRIGDNLERTALHYAMGMDKIEVLSRILIKAGARRVLKDLKGRQATYYFMNKSDILRLKEEEEEKIGGVMNTNDYTEIES